MQCRIMSKRVLSALLVGTTIVTQAVPAYGQPDFKVQQRSETAHTFATGKLTATLDVTGGGSVHLKASDGIGDWNHSTGSAMMGATCILNSDGTQAVSTVGSQKESILEFDGSGMGSLELTGDVNGKKSYFVFEDEVYFLGQGLNKTDSSQADLTSVTMVENMPVTAKNKITFLEPNMGGRWTTKDNLKIENIPTRADNGNPAGSSTPKWKLRNWLCMSEPIVTGTDARGYGYIFKDNIYTTGLKYQTIGDCSTFQAWIPHDGGSNSYSFSVSAQESFNQMNQAGSNTTYNSKVSELSNTEQVQSVFYAYGGVGIRG